MAAFFVKFTLMIPYYLEQLIHQGKGEHKTFSGAMAENLILKVPDKSFIVIYEYWYKPLLTNLGADTGTTYNYQQAMQFVNFYNSNGYSVYWHEVHPDILIKNGPSIPTENPTNGPLGNESYQMPSGDHTDYRSLYLKTDRDLSIYFTMLNQDTVTSAAAAAPNFDPLSNYFGYVGNNIMTGAQGYQNLVATGQTYAPLANPITQVAAPGTREDFTNDVFSFAAGSGGFFPPFSAYGQAGNSARGKARAHHFQCNYVLISEESPKNFR